MTRSDSESKHARMNTILGGKNNKNQKIYSNLVSSMLSSPKEEFQEVDQSPSKISK